MSRTVSSARPRARLARSAAVVVATSVCASCAGGVSTERPGALALMARDATQMTVHDITDGQPMVASGIVACVREGGPITVTSVVAKGQRDGPAMKVTDFGVLMDTPGPSMQVPAGQRGRLADVPARSAGRVIATPCADADDQTPREASWLAWEVTGSPSTSRQARSFTVHYRSQSGAEGTVDVPVGITLCPPGDTAGDCGPTPASPPGG